jgi:hypothetical protein
MKRPPPDEKRAPRPKSVVTVTKHPIELTRMLATACRSTHAGARPTALRPDEKVVKKDDLSEETKVSLSLMRSLMGGASKRWRFKLSTALTMSTNGSGLFNSTVSAATATTLAEFSPLSQLFNEFFIRDFELSWVPSGIYTGQIPSIAPATTNLNLPIGIASYHHGATLPTSLAGLGNNPTLLYTSSGDTFKYTWRNVEDPDSETVVVSAELASTPSQGWCLTAASPSEAYTGQVLILSNSSPAAQASTVAGVFMFTANVLFRTRV